MSFDGTAIADPQADRPICTIIAAPNGAGKTTFALGYLPTVGPSRNFVNADSIASGLSPLDPEKAQLEASRLFLAEVHSTSGAGSHLRSKKRFPHAAICE